MSNQQRPPADVVKCDAYIPFYAPFELKEAIKRSARLNKRSVSKELVATLMYVYDVRIDQPGAMVISPSASRMCKHGKVICVYCGMDGRRKKPLRKKPRRA